LRAGRTGILVNSSGKLVSEALERLEAEDPEKARVVVLNSIQIRLVPLGAGD
jgi:hypothetical protein